VETDDHDREAIRASVDVVSHLLAVGQFTRAKEHAQNAVAANPHDPTALTNLARVLLLSGDSPGAVSACEAAIEIDPVWASPWSIRAVAELRQGHFSASERSIREAIRLEPDEAHFFLTYARILFACGKEQLALARVRTALELDPDDDDAHQLFARLLHTIAPSKWRLSADVALRAVALDPENDDAHAILGWIRLTANQIDEAESSFRTSLELSPHNRLALSGLAHVVMAKAWWYRPFLWYSITMARLGTALQLFVVVGLWGIVSALHLAVTSRAIDDLLTYGYLGLCAYTWFAEPVTRGILRRRYAWL